MGQKRRRGRRGATTSNSGSGRTSQRCWRRRWASQTKHLPPALREPAHSCLCSLSGRTCLSGLSPTTCQPWPRPPRCPLDTSAASAATLRTTPALPVGGATAAASVSARTERPGTSSATVRQLSCFYPSVGLFGYVFDCLFTPHVVNEAVKLPERLERDRAPFRGQEVCVCSPRDSDGMNSLQVFEVDTLTSSSHHALQAGPASTEPLSATM